MKILYLLILILLWIEGSAMAQKNTQIVYKEIEGTTLKMDIYYPPDHDTGNLYPAMVFFFGGGWKQGSVKQFEPHAKYFSQKGIVCFLADYRVESRQNSTPFESLKDAKSAVRFIREHAGDFHVDPAKIVASGGSAGGHLAAATALIKNFNEEGEDFTVSCIPNALVLFNPVIDNSPGGYGYDRIGRQYKDFSPLHNIKEGAPPTIIFLGTNDRLIPVETAKYYQKIMEKVGSRCELRLYEGEGHGFFNFSKPNNYKKTVFEADIFLQSLGYIKKEPVDDSALLPDLALQPAHVITSPWPEHYAEVTRQGVPSIEKTAGGRLWAAWVKNPDGPLSYVVLVTSNDNWNSWSEIKLVIQPRRLVRTRMPCLWIDPKGRMWFFWGQNAGQNDGRGGVWTIMTGDPDSEEPAWSKPRRISNGYPLNKPTVLSNGDWLLPVSTMGVKINLGRYNISPYAEEMLAHSIGEETGSKVYRSQNEGQTFEFLGQADVTDTWDEHMIVERRDGNLWMLVRTDYGIGQSTSTDMGKSWSPGTPYMENPGVANKRFFIRRLQSGALLMVRNNGPTKARTHLTAFISDDEGASWKGGLLLDERSSSYPDGIQDENGTIYIIYDHKRSPDGVLLMAAFGEEDVRAGKAVTDNVRLQIEIDRLRHE